MKIFEQADAHRNEAKRLLGQFIADQAVANQIVDNIVSAAMLGMVGMQRDAIARLNATKITPQTHS